MVSCLFASGGVRNGAGSGALARIDLWCDFDGAGVGAGQGELSDGLKGITRDRRKRYNGRFVGSRFKRRRCDERKRGWDIMVVNLREILEGLTEAGVQTRGGSLTTCCTTRTVRSGTATATTEEGATTSRKGRRATSRRNTGSIAQPKPRILPKTPGTLLS